MCITGSKHKIYTEFDEVSPFTLFSVTEQPTTYKIWLKVDDYQQTTFHISQRTPKVKSGIFFSETRCTDKLIQMILKLDNQRRLQISF